MCVAMAYTVKGVHAVFTEEAIAKFYKAKHVKTAYTPSFTVYLILNYFLAIALSESVCCYRIFTTIPLPNSETHSLYSSVS